MTVDKENIASLIEEYQSLNLSAIIDFDKFNQYSIVHHSTTIEGSTLTEIETRLLLDEGLTPKGKPILHSLMVQDHYKALVFVLGEAKKKTTVTPSLIQHINAAVIKNTEAVYNTALGEIDSTKGMYRKGNVSAGISYFVNYDKVPGLTDELCKKISERIPTAETIEDKLNLSFDAHFDLVTIHPFYDGNGRSSRLLMNFIQYWHGLPLSIVFKEDKAEYFKALIDTRAKADISIFRSFMYEQTAKHLAEEIRKYKELKNPGTGGKFSIVF